MARFQDAATAWAALERRYDGPIPPSIRELARAGSADRLLLSDATAQATFFAALIRDQIEAIRRARREGPIPAGLIDDLTLYRRQERWWRREADRLRAAIAAKPSAVGAP